MNPLEKNVIITGISSGIGAATGRLFKENGWNVIGIDRNSDPKYFEDYPVVHGDVSSNNFWKSFIQNLNERNTGIDALINNAAIQLCKPLVETLPEEWDEIMAVNLRSTYLAVKHLHPFLKSRNGAVVNVGSVHALATSANIAAYAASKGGLLALTRALAVELAGDGIRVNAVLPGAVDTPMLRAGLHRGHLEGSAEKDLLEDLGRKTVCGRIGKPIEIAHAIYFLSNSETSAFITGQSLTVDGGATARLSTE